MKGPVDMPSTLPRLAPPRIGICGGSSVDKRTGQFCSALGRALAQMKDAVLVTGGCMRRIDRNGDPLSRNLAVDWHTIEGAKSILHRADQLTARIETVLPGHDPKKIEKFYAGRTIPLPGASPQARRFQLLASVDVVVAIAGTRGTRQHLDLALALERPLLPLPFFGGESAKAWKRNKDAIIRSMRLSTEDVRFLDAGSGKGKHRHQPSPNALAKRVTSMLRRRLTKVCMVLMPFAPTYNRIYTILAGAVEEVGLLPFRTDRAGQPLDIVDTINRGIEACECAIAVLDGLRPNVFYELGRAHAYDKPVLILLREGTKPPFDIAGLSYIAYKKPDASLAKSVEAQLRSITAAASVRRLIFSA